MGGVAMAWVAARSGASNMVRSERRRQMANLARMPMTARFVIGRYPALPLVLALPITGG
jgi:hypothetical protein